MMRLAVIDPDEARLHALAARGVRGATVSTTMDDCDAVVFLGCAPAGVADVLRAGKDVLVTLDAGMSRALLQSLGDVANGAGRRFVVANPERYLPSRQLIKQQLDAGKLGAPGLVRLHRWQPGESTQALLRDLDLVLWYFGQGPNVVYAVEQTIHLGFPGGGMALLAHVDHLPAGDTYCYLSLIGSNGAAYADDHQNMQLAFRGGSPQAIRVGEGIAPWTALVEDFLPADARRSSIRDAFPAWPQVLAVSDAVATSLRTGQAVALEGVPCI